MPDSKISQLTAGAAPLESDLIVVARGATNRKLTLREAIGLRAGRKNFIRNGDFKIAQRGTSFGVTGSGYTLDGWISGGAGTSTVSRQLFPVGDVAVADNPIYMARNDRTVAAGVDNVIFEQRIETPWRFSGFPMVASLNARVVAGVKALKLNLFSSGVTPAIDVDIGTINLTNLFQKFEAATVVPAMTAISGPSAYLALRVIERAAYNTFTFDMADVQFERGTVATAFERLEEEEQARWCQRFFEKSYELGTAPGTATEVGMVEYLSPNAFNSQMKAADFKATKRAIPTVAVYSTLSGAAGNGFNVGAAADVAMSAEGIGDSGFCAYLTAGPLNNALVRFQWTASAEL